jgi:hypothetical protein
MLQVIEAGSIPSLPEVVLELQRFQE